MIKIKLIQSTLERNFTVTHQGKTYYVSYLNSDGQILGLLNRTHWEVLDEELEEVSVYIFRDTTKKEEQQIDKNVKLTNKLIKFCIKHFDDYELNVILSQRKLLDLTKDVHKVYLDKKIEHYIVQIIDATRNPDKYNLKLGKYIEWGSSPRGAISLYIGAKSEALNEGQIFVTPHHVKEVAHDVLRHRVLLNYEGQSESVTTDDAVSEILSKVPVP